MTDLDDGTRGALREALDDEYKARATYRAVIARFGAVRPFSRIVESEERHIAALAWLFDRHGVPMPPDRWAGAVEPPATIGEACRAGVQAEIDNAALYDRLMTLAGHAPEDVRRVFTNLRDASQERHLPAFRRCAAAGERPAGHGRCRARARAG